MKLSAAALVAAVIAASTASAIFIEDDVRGISNTNIMEIAATTKTYLVTFNDNTIPASEQCNALAKLHGGTVKTVYQTVLNGCSLTMPTDGQAQEVSTQSMLTALSNDLRVAMVELDQPVYASQTPPLSLFAAENGVSSSAVTTTPLSWGLDRIDQCALPIDSHMTKQDATGVNVFIIDTGIMNDHVELASSMSNDDCHFSSIAGEGYFSDGHGHG
jgi:subtilisin family serine protease